MGTLAVLMLTGEYAGSARVSDGLWLERIEYYPSQRTAEVACKSYCSVHPPACCVMITLGQKSDVVDTACVLGRKHNDGSRAKDEAVSFALRATRLLVSAIRASNRAPIREGE